MRRVLCLVLLAAIIVCGIPGAAWADDVGIAVYLENELLDLEHPAQVKDGIPYIPLVETFFAMGVPMTYDEDKGTYVGVGNNGEIKATVGDDIVYVDWVNIQLPGKIYETEDKTVMIPAYAVEDALKTKPYVYDEIQNKLYLFKPKFGDNASNSSFSLVNEVKKLSGGIKICDDDPLFNTHPDSGEQYVKMEEVDVSDQGMPFQRAIQVETLPLENNQVPTVNYSIQRVANDVGGDFEAGDVGIMTYWARAIKITDESGSAGLRLCYERTEDYHKLSAQGDGSVTVGYEWQQYYEVLCNQRYPIPSNRSRLCIGVGYKPQIIQIAGLKVINYKDTVSLSQLLPDAVGGYKGMEEDALWRKEANRRIEKYRKNDMYISVKDESGKPIEDVDVNVDMTKSEFIYGDTVMRREFLDMNPDLKSTELQNEFYEKYLNTIIDSFIKWEVSYYDDGRNSIQTANHALSVLKKQVRAHCLLWDGADLYPKVYKNFEGMSYDEIYDIFVEHTIKYMWCFKDKAIQWDVLNEPHDSNLLRERYGYGYKLFADMIKLAKKIDPNTPLYLNETGIEGKNTEDQYTRENGVVRIIESLMDLGAPLDGVGVQAHCTTMWYPQGFYWQADTVSKPVKNFAVTEFDLFSTESAEVCKQYMEDMMRITYSHPKATGFLVWGHYDLNHWRRDSNFYDEHYNPKYGLEVFEKLILDEWWTRESGVTDADGIFNVRGHRGDYEITVTYNGNKTVIPFTLVQSDNDSLDNRVDIVIGNDGTVSSTVTNSPKELPTPIEFDTFSEAYADFMAKFGNNEEPIRIVGGSSDMDITPDMTYDQSEKTYYESKNDVAWVSYELSDEAYSGIVSINWKNYEDDTSHAYEVFTSKDGVNWKSVYTGESRKINTVGYEDTKYLKIQYKGGSGFGISEVTVDALKEGK